MTDPTPDVFDQASADFDAAHSEHEQLAQHEAVLDALEDFVVALAPAALELGLSLAPGGSALATALRVAEKALPVVVERLQGKTPVPPAPASPRPPSKPPTPKPGL